MLEALSLYRPTDVELQAHGDIRSLIERDAPQCFYRTHFDPGHVTGSGLLISADGSRVLMNHHAFLDIWICFGGHADGEQDIFNVALREVVEESGIENIEPVMTGIFDVDVHPIPANAKKNEPPHRHFDVRFLYRVKDKADEAFAQSEESKNMRWCSFDEAVKLAAPHDISMHRMLHKWRDLT